MQIKIETGCVRGREAGCPAVSKVRPRTRQEVIAVATGDPLRLLLFGDNAQPTVLRNTTMGFGGTRIYPEVGC